jgi:hypothetical protein
LVILVIGGDFRLMGTKDLVEKIRLMGSSDGFVEIGDWFDVRQDGGDEVLYARMVGPSNGGDETERSGYIHSRDYGRLGLFFVTMAIKTGGLGDIEKSVREVLDGRVKFGVKHQLNEEKDVVKG